MSDILIKSIEMPTGNDELRLIIRSNGQVIISHETYYEETEAVPVPPHGRLGDLDKLEQMFVDIDNASYSGFDGEEPFYSAEDAAQIIRLAPTIIPADTILGNEIHIIDTKGKSNYDPKRRFVISSSTIIPESKEK